MKPGVRSGSIFGLTIVEVLIAIVIMAVGILALAQLQATSLRNTAVADAINRTTRLVRGELEWQRQTALEPASIECSALVPDDFEECKVEIVPCALEFPESGGGALNCGPAVAPSAYRVTVRAVGPRNQSLELSTLWTGIYIAGAAGGTND